MVFLRVKKTFNKSSTTISKSKREDPYNPEKSTGVGLGRTSSSTSVTGSDEGSDAESDSTTSGIRVSPLIRGSAFEDFPIAVEQSLGKHLGTSQELKPEQNITEDHEVSFTDKDCYGQRHPKENPALIAKRLKAFDAVVSALPKKKRATLQKAIERCPELLNEGFKLQFLRCECFNVKVSTTVVLLGV